MTGPRRPSTMGPFSDGIPPWIPPAPPLRKQIPVTVRANFTKNHVMAQPTHKILIPASSEYEDLEVHYPKLRLEAAGFGVVVATPDGKDCVGKHGYPLKADASLQDVYETLFITNSPAPTKAALNMLGHRVGGVRLPLADVDAAEAEAVRAMLVRHGLREQIVA